MAKPKKTEPEPANDRTAPAEAKEHKPKIRAAEVRQVPRSKLRPSPYNPRRIDPAAEAQLRKGLEDFGLMETLVWNEETGNLVGGHQRLRLLDRDRRWKEGDPDYLVPVAVVRLSPTREKEANVRLNNVDIQGQFDFVKVGEMLELDHDVTLDGMGLDRTTFQLLAAEELADYDLSHLIGETSPPADAEQLAKIKAARKGHKDKDNAVQGEVVLSLQFTPTADFTAEEIAEAFLSKAGIEPGVRFLDGYRVFLNLGMDKPDGPDGRPADDTP